MTKHPKTAKKWSLTRTMRFHLIMLALLAGAYALGANKPHFIAKLNGYSAQTIVFSEKIKKFDMTQMQKILSEAHGRPTLLFIYASWCPYCKEQFKQLAHLRTQGDFDEAHLQLRYISLDSDANALADFLRKQYPDQPFIYYHVPTGDPRTVFYTQMKTRYGAHLDGHVPYLIAFDAQAKPVQEHVGTMEERALIRTIALASVHIQPIFSPDKKH